MYKIIANDNSIRLTHVSDINNNATFIERPDEYRHSFCFKGDPTRGGHYVYISHENKVYGTYETGALCENDDGVCHLYALYKAVQINLSLQSKTSHFLNGFVFFDTGNPHTAIRQSKFDFADKPGMFDPYNGETLLINYYLILSLAYNLLNIKGSTNKSVWEIVQEKYHPEYNSVRPQFIENSNVALVGWFSRYARKLIEKGIIMVIAK